MQILKNWANILLKACGAHTTRFLKYVWPFFNIINERVKPKDIKKSNIINSVFLESVCSKQYIDAKNVTRNIFKVKNKDTRTTSGGPYHIEASPLICSARSNDWLLYDRDLRTSFWCLYC